MTPVTPFATGTVMSQTATRFTPTALADLGAALAADGAAPHEARLLSVALAARAGGAAPAVVEVLADPGASDVVRQRAFAVAVRSVRV